MATAPAPTPSSSPDQPGVCHHRNCRKTIYKRATHGPDRRYCSDVCRQAEYRHRKHEKAPGHAPPPHSAPSDTPLDDAMRLIAQEVHALTERQAISNYGQNILRAFRLLEAAKRSATSPRPGR